MRRATGGAFLPRMLLRAAPAAFRRQYGRQLLAFCDDRLRNRRRVGESWVRVWSRILADLLATITLEWVRVVARRRTAVVSLPRTRRKAPEEPVSALLREVVVAVRAMRRNVAFTAAAVLTLALGLSATTAIFSVVESVLLRPLPYPESGRIVVPELQRIGAREGLYITYADFMDWRDNAVFDAVAVYQRLQMDLTGRDEPVRVNAAAVGPQFFAALRDRPARGRALDSADYPLDAPRAVVISDALWRTQFGAREDIVGELADINGIKRPIVGVLQRGAQWPLDVDVWVPLRLSSESHPDVVRRDNQVYQGIARLKRGATIESTAEHMRVLAARAAADHPVIRKDMTAVPTPVMNWMLGDTTPRALWLLLGAVGLLLLIACVNVANLQLARAAARQRELAVRTALGASRYRLVRQTLVESTMLGLTGGVIGVVLAQWLLKAIVAAAPPDVPRLAAAALNLPALAFALGISLLVALLFGLLPAVQASRSNPSRAMGESTARTSSGRTTSRTRRTLVVAELALSVVLLVGAGLALRSIQQLRHVDPGFDAPSVLTATFSLPGIRYGTSADVVRFMHELRDRLAVAPGILGAGITSASPLGSGGFYLGRSMAEEGKAPIPENEVPVQWSAATPGYFDALGVPIRGRDFGPRDDGASPQVMIVSESFAKAMFGSADAIGRRAMSTRDEKVYREIVGVVPDVKFNGLRDSSRALVWVPYAQNAWNIGVVTVRTAGTAVSAVGTLRREVAALDPNLALANVVTMEQAAARSIASDRMLAVLLTAFATLALALAAVGIFGVLSYTVAQRTRELGVRVALGAQRGDVVGLVMRETAPLIGLGIAIGLATGMAFTALMRSMLFGIQPLDPLTFITVAMILTVVGLLAAILPARRAAGVSPMVALRSD